MKRQQVVIDYWIMLKTSATYLALAFCGYILLKLLYSIIYLPQFLANNQRRIEEMSAKIDDSNSEEIQSYSSEHKDNMSNNFKKQIKKTK